MHIFPAYDVYSCGDHAFTLDFGQQIDVNINKIVIGLFHQLQQSQQPYILDIIPAYSSITMVYDPMLIHSSNTDPEMMIKQYLTDVIQQTEHNTVAASPNMIQIPVCYHPSLAPDLETVCLQHQIDIETLITLHTQKTYRVFMNGFLPGFAYMGSVDERIATPRHASPRKKVPAGSVGIAGIQTGIYPFESPGGWQLIGRTPVALFNPDAKQPCLLSPGDEVQFYAVSPDSYQQSISS